MGFMDEIEQLFEAGGLVLVGIGLACLQYIVVMAEAAKEKGDKEPMVSAFGYLIVGAIGGIVLNFIFPIIGFFLGFPLALKLYLGKNISFWAVLFYPIISAIYAFVFIMSLAWIAGGLEDDNMIAVGLGGVIFLGTFYSGIAKYFME